MDIEEQRGALKSISIELPPSIPNVSAQNINEDIKKEKRQSITSRRQRKQKMDILTQERESG